VTRIGKWLRLVAFIFSFVILVLLLTGIYSIMPGNLDVAITGNVQPELPIQQGVIRLRVPATIANRGFYDSRDIVVHVDAVDTNGTPVFQAQSDAFTIPAGFVFDQDVVVAVNLTEAYQLHGSYYLFHSGDLNMSVTISCRYLLNLLGAVVRISNLTMHWAAPLQDFAVNVTQVTFIPYGAGFAVNGTLQVTNNGWLGLSQTGVRSELQLINGTLITFNQTAVDLVPGVTQHAVIYPLTDPWRLYLLSNNATLRLNCTVSPLGVTFFHSQLIGWIAPPSGGTPPGSPGNPAAAMSFARESGSAANSGSVRQVASVGVPARSRGSRRLRMASGSGSPVGHGGVDH